jgi:GT2 family glycosyltransferase
MSAQGRRTGGPRNKDGVTGGARVPEAEGAAGPLRGGTASTVPTVVLITRDRRASLLRTLARLAEFADGAPVIVVDNRSSDGTPDAVAERHPDVELIRLDGNDGAAARTAGVLRAGTPYVAFSDDDSWWGPGSLERAARLLDTHPRCAVVAGEILLGDSGQPDPLCAEMAASPLPPRCDLPGIPILGFAACGAVVRRDAYLQVGGFSSRLGVGGEEELLAMDLAALGHGLAYCPSLIAHHHPSPIRDHGQRRRRVARNTLWCAWSRRRALGAAAVTARVLRGAIRDRSRRAGVVDAVRGARAVMRERRPVPREVERDLRLLDAQR